MALRQSIDGWLERNIGKAGLSDAGLNKMLGQMRPAMDRLREAYERETLPLLRVPEWRDDIAAARTALTELSRGAETLVFYGTGGSSLGGQTIVQLGGWHIPGDEGKGPKPRPRIRFYDNLDGRTLERSLASLDLATTRFVLTSKSGNTPETTMQALAAIQAVRAAGLEKRIPELFLIITEPSVSGVQNGMRALAAQEGIPTLDHDPGIGGRFSSLSNVGMLPAMAKGLDPEAIRKGAARVVKGLLDNEPEDFAPALGAAAAIGLAKEKDIRAMVLMTYSDRLVRLSHWYVQLWAESLGKSGQGTTPVAASGPVDQHSQLQLYMDGPNHHALTIVRTDCAGIGPAIDKDLADLVGAPYLAGFTAGDLVAAQQRAIPDALLAAGRPVRTLDVGTLDEAALGELLMHFMLETILAAAPLGIDPFDQPAVEAGKILTKKYLSEQAKETRGARPPATADAG